MRNGWHRAVHAVGGTAQPSGHWQAARSAPRIGGPDDDLVLAGSRRRRRRGGERPTAARPSSRCAGLLSARTSATTVQPAHRGLVSSAASRLVATPRPCHRSAASRPTSTRPSATIPRLSSPTGSTTDRREGRRPRRWSGQQVAPVAGEHPVRIRRTGQGEARPQRPRRAAGERAPAPRPRSPLPARSRPTPPPAL